VLSVGRGDEESAVLVAVEGGHLRLTSGLEEVSEAELVGGDEADYRRDGKSQKN
jgi:hypothetical protein